MHKLPLSENRSRVQKVREAMDRAGVKGLYLTSPVSIFYLAGVSTVATERPAALVVPREGEVVFVGPRLEESHVRLSENLVDRVWTYFDYPGHEHPMEQIAGFLQDLGLGASPLWADNPAGYGGLFGYRGPKLSDLLPEATLVSPGDLIMDMRLVKSPAEIALLEESARWGDVAMELLVSRSGPGRWDVEVEMEASLEASRRLRAAAGGAFAVERWGSFPVHAGFRGQVGTDSAIPHAFATKKPMEAGDVLGTGASAQIGGYESELERALVVGPPTDEQRRLFAIMVEAQDAALAAVGPGATCASVDGAAFAVLEKRGAADLALHHTGHGRGLEAHEPPYLDLGNDAPLRAGMVLCLEPGLYVEGKFGFRHSDTVVVTEDGCRRITRFPRDIESCTIPV